MNNLTNFLISLLKFTYRIYIFWHFSYLLEWAFFLIFNTTATQRWIQMEELPRWHVSRLE